MPPLAGGAGEGHRAIGDRPGLAHTAGQEQRLAQQRQAQRLSHHDPAGLGLRHPLLEQRQGVVGPSRQSPRRTQADCQEREHGGNAGGPAQFHTALEDGDGLVDLALAQMEEPHTEIGVDQGPRPVDLLGEPERLFPAGPPGLELSHLCQRPHQPGAGAH